MSERIVYAGIDEAGYGPLLGPLCVGVCAISVPAELCEAAKPASCRLEGHLDLWDVLAEAVSEDTRGTDRRTIICDSKQLHDPNKLRPLEETVLTLHAARSVATGATALPPTLRALLDEVSLTPPARLTELPWYDGEALHEALPVEALADKCWLRGQTLAQCLAGHAVQLERIRVEPVEVPTFNALLEQATSKADAELAVIAKLLAKMWERFPRLRVVVDRLGARDYYAPMLQQAFPGLHVETRAESQPLPPSAAATLMKEQRKKKASAKAKSKKRTSKYASSDDGEPRYSRYRVHGPGGAELDVTFSTGAEQISMPVAVASLFAKYVREGCMRALNRYWQARIPRLRPTKGYVQDGRRFLADLEAALGTEAIEEVRPLLVRNR